MGYVFRDETIRNKRSFCLTDREQVPVNIVDKQSKYRSAAIISCTKTEAVNLVNGLKTSRW